MKKISTQIMRQGFASILALSLACNVFAQEAATPLSLGSMEEFKNSFSKIDVLAKKVYVLPIAGNKQVTINISEKNCNANECFVFGTVEGHEQAKFFIRGDEKNMTGKLIFIKTKEAYDIYTSAQGEVFIAPVAIHKVICMDYPSYEGEQQNNTAKNNSAYTTIVPTLNSLPGGYGTIYLDFDGENVNGYWGAINAAPSNFTDADITKIWLIISEDYMPFNVNVTTDRAIFNAAPVSRKQMLILTPTSTALPGSGGATHLNSWGTNDPCWSFGQTIKSAAEAGSHELGHSLNLNHDGTASQGYYAGHNNWGPIMGACLGQYLVQWSKGEYANANNAEDDLAKITIKIPYRADDADNYIANAKALVINGNGTGNVSSATNFGLIEKRTDKDVFQFTTSGGNVSFSIVSHKEGIINTSVPDLDIQARFLDGSENEILKVNPTGAASATLTISNTFAAGTYYLEIDGVGSGDPLTTGYTDYGSLGQYFISGTVPNAAGTGVNETDAKYDINIFPNPSLGVFTINIPKEGNDASRIEILNNVGQTVVGSSEAASGKINKEINISGLASGIYCVVVTSGSEVWKGKVLLK